CMSNMEKMFGPHDGKEEDIPHAPLPQNRPGFVCLSFDELATEQRVEYFDNTDEMGGFCIEHVNKLKSIVIGDDTTTLEAAANAIRGGEVHIAHEATVGAISRHARSNYSANP
ncbi:hypothetical protein MPER_00147, partial [Moniliophthora perniciosa FA553]